MAILDGNPRTVSYVTDLQGQVLTRRESDHSDPAAAMPRDAHYYFYGVRVGSVTNDAGWDDSYTEAATRRRAPDPAGAFVRGTGPTPGADFDQAYEGLTPGSTRATGSALTVRDGDTLQSIATAAWGDASLWYLIADANGLTSASLLTAGQVLTLPANTANVHNTSETFRPYDPNKAIGDVNPTQPKPPTKQGGCGVVGQVIALVIAAAVVYLTKGAGSKLAVALVKAAGLTGTTAAVTATVVAASATAAVANTASQAFLIATGAQDRFDWKQLGMSALSAGVSAGLPQIPGLQSLPRGFQEIAHATASNVVTQGVAVATGLQSSFNWTQVGVEALGIRLPGPGGAVINGIVNSGIEAALTGESFTDTLMANLPQTIGNIVAAGLREREEAKTKSGSMSVSKSDDQMLALTPVEIAPGIYEISLPDGTSRTLTREEVEQGLQKHKSSPRSGGDSAGTSGSMIARYEGHEMAFVDGGTGTTFQSVLGWSETHGLETGMGLLGDAARRYEIGVMSRDLIYEMEPYGDYNREFALYAAVGALLAPEYSAELLGVADQVWRGTEVDDIVVTGVRNRTEIPVYAIIREPDYTNPMFTKAGIMPQPKLRGYAAQVELPPIRNSDLRGYADITSRDRFRAFQSAGGITVAQGDGASTRPLTPGLRARFSGTDVRLSVDSDYNRLQRYVAAEVETDPSNRAFQGMVLLASGMSGGWSFAGPRAGAPLATANYAAPRIFAAESASGRALVPFDGAYATQQLLGTTTTPGGRQIMFHAADRMVNPPTGRASMTPAEIDQVLDGATKIVKRDFHPAGNTLTIENSNMVGRPRVVVDEATGQRVITVIRRNR